MLSVFTNSKNMIHAIYIMFHVSYNAFHNILIYTFLKTYSSVSKKIFELVKKLLNVDT